MVMDMYNFILSIVEVEFVNIEINIFQRIRYFNCNGCLCVFGVFKNIQIIIIIRIFCFLENVSFCISKFSFNDV